MTPADLLDLRRRVARVLPSRETWARVSSFHPALIQLRRGAALGEYTDADGWLPVLDDPGTQGAMTARLVELAAARGWGVRVTYASAGQRAEVEVRERTYPFEGRVCELHAETGVALALALDAIATQR